MIPAEIYFLLPLFLCWGSFLNVLAYRLIQGQSILSRSCCVQCNQQIAWHDNIPLLSWLLLGGKCRSCKKSISFLYPFIEALTAITLLSLYVYIPHHYFLSYFIFFSALIVTIRSDLETMFISRFMTIPFGIFLSMQGLLPISTKESIYGAVFGYLFLFIINRIFKYWRKSDGIGEGDFDLLLYIGSFTGIIGCWMSVTIGSLLGSLYGLTIIFFTQHNASADNSIYATKIPFGPFLAFGAIIFVFIQKYIFHFMAL